jgi:dynamin family protein
MLVGGAAPRLTALARLAVEAGVPAVAAEARRLGERPGEGRFYVVCLGQFKRGKSTLINALIEAPVLPTGIVPVTSVLTVLRHGPRLAARVRHDDGEWEACDPAGLAGYVSEAGNPGNARGLKAVEVFVPAALLDNGLCLVDTPGIGSVILANTQATQAFIPHVDVALVVLGAEPPITGEELALVRAIAATGRDLIVVFNKADRHTDAERAEAVAFTERVLRDALGRSPGPVLQVSAVERLAGRGPLRDWTRLVNRLREMARASGADVVETAEARESAALAAWLQHELEERRGALLRPIDETERWTAAVQAAVGDAERALTDLRYLMMAEEATLARRFEEARSRFLTAALPDSRRALTEALRDAPGPARVRRRVALQAARDVAQRWLEPWRRQQEPGAEAIYRDVERRFVDLANGLGERLSAAAAVPPAPALWTLGFRARRRFQATELMQVAPISPGSWLLDGLLPRWRRRAVERDAARYLARLLEVNSARLKNHLQALVTDNRGRVEQDVRERLQALVAGATDALEEARRVRSAGAATLAARLAALDVLLARVRALCSGQDEDGGVCA